MCIFQKPPSPKPAPPPPNPADAAAAAEQEQQRRAAAGAAYGRRSTMLTNLTDAQAATPVGRKTLLGQ
jgi:hypothetical protein